MNNKYFLTLLLIVSPCIYADSWPGINLLSTSREQLSAVTQITIEKDPVYKTKKQYRAFPLTPIIKKLAKNLSKPLTNILIVFTAADGYKVTMAYQDALLEKGYLAFKDLSAKNASWIEFKFGHEHITPAPYYLLWPNPELDKWRYPSPFQLTSLSLQSADKYFSSAAPTSNNPVVKQGFTLFSRYCIRCHSVNHAGGKVGPELTRAKNTTAHFSPSKLADFILDAPSYRANTKMPVFKNILDKKEALKIQRYLRSMKPGKQE